MEIGSKLIGPIYYDSDRVQIWKVLICQLIRIKSYLTNMEKCVSRINKQTTQFRGV